MTNKFKITDYEGNSEIVEAEHYIEEGSFIKFMSDIRRGKMVAAFATHSVKSIIKQGE